MPVIKKTLVSLQFKTTADFDKNLNKLLSLLKKVPKDAIVVAPEVCLTGFCYERMKEASIFNKQAQEKIRKACAEFTFISTFIEEQENEFLNTARVFYKGECVHKQSKYKLFPLGEEDKHFKNGKMDDISCIEIDGIKLGVLICFEIRFNTLWQKLRGADVIVVCAQWGKSRAKNFKTLTTALATMNQCYVIASDSANKEAGRESGIISPFGDDIRNKNKNSITLLYEQELIKKMRRYINVGIV